MNPMGHVEMFKGLGWRPDYHSRDRMAANIAYGQYADFGVKASATALSVGLLVSADTPLEKVLFGISTAILGAITLASAYETF